MSTESRRWHFHDEFLPIGRILAWKLNSIKILLFFALTNSINFSPLFRRFKSGQAEKNPPVGEINHPTPTTEKASTFAIDYCLTWFRISFTLKLIFKRQPEQENWFLREIELVSPVLGSIDLLFEVFGTGKKVPNISKICRCLKPPKPTLA